MKNEIVVKAVKTYIEKVSKMKKDNASAQGKTWFFRGQKNATWDVRPSIFRNDYLMSEDKIIDNAMCQNTVELRDCSNKFELLTKLQHYGLGTRLLDLTLNPLVALYFAADEVSSFSKNRNGTYSEKKENGRVLFKLTESRPLYDLSVRLATEVSFQCFERGMTLEKFCDNLKDSNSITQAEFYSLVDNDYSLVIKFLQTNNFIVSANSNMRLIQQRGAFLLAPSININTSTSVKTSILSKAKRDLSDEFDGSFVIRASDKESIREELDFLNINEATLFPELEHQLLYIQNRMKPGVGVVDDFSIYTPKDPGPITTTIPKTKSEIEKIVSDSLQQFDKDTKNRILSIVRKETEIIDWQRKDSVISGIRRSIYKDLSGKIPTVDAKSKTNEIMSKLLK